MTIQQLINLMGAQGQAERAQTQLTLGKLIDVLKAMDPVAQVPNLCDPHSYRGYYCDIAFELNVGTRSAMSLLTECENALGQTFEGYKGGDYTTNANTPVWVALYGSTGDKLIMVHPDGGITVEKDE